MITDERNRKAFLTLEARCLRAVIDAPTNVEKYAAIVALEEKISGITGRASVDNLPPRVVNRLKLIPAETPYPDNAQIAAASRKLSQPTLTFHFHFTSEN